jgi:hypothetical protein
MLVIGPVWARQRNVIAINPFFHAKNTPGIEENNYALGMIRETGNYSGFQ